MTSDIADVDRAIQAARRFIAEARQIVVLTGAGISTDSGIPDFRGPQGLWTRNPEAEKMATIHHYVADPEVRKRAWRSRLESPALTAEPNAGHKVLVELERRGTLLALLTQNVDGLHQKAGSSPSLVVEIHGTAREVTCLSCGERAPMERALARGWRARCTTGRAATRARSGSPSWPARCRSRPSGRRRRDASGPWRGGSDETRQ